VKTSLGVALVLAVLTRPARAQEEPERKFEELRREHERALRSLEEKFAQERARLEKEFRAAREKMLRSGQDRKPEPGRKEASGDLEAQVRELRERVERLERRLERGEPERGRFEFRWPHPRGVPGDVEARVRETLRQVFDELERRGLLRPGERGPEKKKEDRKKEKDD
jgi:exonuclease VII large subunit